MASERNQKIKAFLAVTVFILCVDALFVWINFRDSWGTFQRDSESWRRQLIVSFDNALSATGGNMQEIATYIANEKGVPELFLAAKRAVAAEGGGAGGPEAAKIRKQLFEQVYDGWRRMNESYNVQQLHFHLGPGDISFLRMHEPEKFGDNMASFRHTVVDANRQLVPVKGLETGRIYSGIRGVTPVWAKDRGSGEMVHVGAVEVGTTLSLLLGQLHAGTGCHYVALLKKEHLQSILWPEFLAERVRAGSIGQQLVLETATTANYAFLRSPEILPSLFTDAPCIYKNDGAAILISSFPFKDYYQSSLPEGKAVGYIVAWKDVSRELAGIDKGLTTNIWYGGIAFVLIELSLILAWWYGMRSLEGRVKDSTARLREINSLLGREIQERKDAEALVRMSEDQYRSFFMDNKAVMLIADPHSGEIVDCNKAACAYYQHDHRTMLRLKAWDLDVNEPEFLRKRMQEMISVIGLRADSRNKLASGESRDVVVYAGPIQLRTETKLFVIVHDVTDLKKEETARRRAEKRYHEIFNNAPVGIFRFARSGQLISLNPETARIFGFAREEDLSAFLADDIGKLFYDKRQYETLRAEVEAHGFLNETECRAVRRDGTIIWTSWIARETEDNRDDAWLDCFIYDISERKKLENLRGDVERMTRHDLMGPLTFILNLPELLHLSGPVNMQQQEILDNLEQTGMRMSNMINMSLNLYKMETGAYQFMPCRLDLALILKRVAGELAGFARASDVSVRVEGEDGSPLQLDSVFIMGEELICFTMFLNILKNAIEASPPEHTVTVSLVLENLFAVVRIHNNGEVPPGVLEVFFDKYVTGGKVGGTGLGTYMAKLVARIHSGDIHVASSSQAGTTVTIRLPGIEAEGA